MKIVAVPVLLTLALCLIQDAVSGDANQETCSEFQSLIKNGKLFCSQDKKLLQTPDEIMFMKKCTSCKMILEQEAKSQKRARHLARDTRDTAPAKLNCEIFKKRDKDGKFFCTADTSMICGTDGKTYRSRCELCAENMKSRSQVDIKSEGECDNTNIEQDLCSDFRAQMKDGILGCTRENDPVFGPDGRTHGNKCVMCAELFLKEAKEKAKKEEGNRIRREAEKELCKEFEKQERSGRLFCTRESDPVRGPDGRIHGNKCALCAEIFMKHFLEEKSKAEQNLRNKEEKVKVNKETEELCNEYKDRAKKGILFCTRENDPVRGPDGEMHGNVCSMCLAFFKNQAEEKKAEVQAIKRERSQKPPSYEEICREYREFLKNGKLPCFRENDPVQGPDGKVHRNACSMCEAFFQAEEKKKKESKPRNKRQSEDTASFTKLCKDYRKSMMNGQLVCNREADPITGPDGKVHSNTCSMCEVLFKQEEKARENAKRAATKENCSEFLDQMKDGMLICTRESDPVIDQDGKMHASKCAMCASVFKLEEEKNKDDKKEAKKVEAEKVKREAIQKLCNEYRSQVRDGRLPCTRENDPIEGLDGKIHGNTCSMCEAFFLQETKEKEAASRTKIKRETLKDSCNEYRSLLQGGKLFCTRENDPVRGPDGKTHGNKCDMCKAVLESEDEERKKKEEDSCAEFRGNMKNGELSCTRESDPVRGADGKSYNNKCSMCKELLQREAEEKNKNTSSRSKENGSAAGKDVCDQFRSQMKNGKLLCTRESEPVRGPDGKTHGNKCAMCKQKLEKEAAEKKKKEDEDKRNTGGKNSDKEDQCHEFRDKQRDGKLVCTRENDPVRDRNGKEYTNKCAMCQNFFEQEATERKKEEEKSSSKPSNNEKDQCREVQNEAQDAKFRQSGNPLAFVARISADECREFRKNLRNGKLTCTRQRDPVRGADGKLYKNKCYQCRAIFQKEAFEKARLKEKQSHIRASEQEGSLESSRSSLDSEICKNYRVLPRMGYLCPKNMEPVCGDDGQTYNNPCMLCHENLIRQTNTHIRSKGRCEENSTPEAAPADTLTSDK